ncbi:MAG TPA: Sec-independent protein translocase subunit TatA [Pseudonocardia sp.]|jgi:sec-independent protein translocase protein TatA|nr:Sec-independent protein translocase subunit TatA [Pseudonocardia sp.]
MGELSPTHWLIVILVAVVLFGARRLPDAARSLGRSARILKSEISGIHDDAKPATPDADGAQAAAATDTPQVAPTAQPAALEGTPTSSDQPTAAPADQPEAATPDTATRP